MKKNFLCSFLLTTIVTTNLSGTVHFSNKDATINLKNGSSFFNASNNLVIDGTIEKGNGSSILGNTLTFSQGNLATEQYNDSNTAILWDSAKNIKLNQNTTLSTTWGFAGTNYLNGNGQTLDLSNNGQLVLQPNAQLYLTDMHLKGLGNKSGSGQFIFMNDSSNIVLSNVTVEVDNDISTTIGGIQVNGPTTFMLGENNWTFDQNGSLTVDAVTLWQDPLDIINYGKVKFGSEELSNYLSLVSNGTIKTLANLDILMSDTIKLQEQITENSWAILALRDDVTENSNAIVNNSWAIQALWYDVVENSNAIVNNSWAIQALWYDVVENSNAIVNNSWAIQALWERMPMIFKEHKIFDTGMTHTVGEKRMVWFEGGFTVIPDSELNLYHEAYIYNPVVLNENSKLTMATNVYFASDMTFTTGGLINANGNLLEFMGDVLLDHNKTLRFISDAVIDCNENSFELGNNAQLLIDNNVTLTLRNVKLKNLQDNFLSGIAMAENSYLTLQNVELALSDNYTLTRGKLFIHNNVLVSGTSSMIYQSNLECRIDEQALIKFDNGTSLVYAPQTGNQNLIIMPNETSWLMLSGAEFGTTFTSIQLTKGTLLIDGKVTFSNPGATQSEAIKFGDGTSANNDLNVKVLPGATINIDGAIVNQNVN